MTDHLLPFLVIKSKCYESRFRFKLDIYESTQWLLIIYASKYVFEYRIRFLLESGRVRTAAVNEWRPCHRLKPSHVTWDDWIESGAWEMCGSDANFVLFQVWVIDYPTWRYNVNHGCCDLIANFQDLFPAAPGHPDDPVLTGNVDTVYYARFNYKQYFFKGEEYWENVGLSRGVNSLVYRGYWWDKWFDICEVLWPHPNGYHGYQDILTLPTSCK